MRLFAILKPVVGALAFLVLLASFSPGQQKQLAKFNEPKGNSLRQPVYYLEYYFNDVGYYIPIILGTKGGKPVAIQIADSIVRAQLEGKKREPSFPIDWIEHFLGKEQPTVISIRELKKCNIECMVENDKTGPQLKHLRLPGDIGECFIARKPAVGNGSPFFAIWRPNPQGETAIFLIKDALLFEKMRHRLASTKLFPKNKTEIEVGRDIEPSNAGQETLLIFPHNAPGDARIILQYPTPMPPGSPESRRLVLDLDRIIVPKLDFKRPWDPRAQVMADAFGNTSGTGFTPYPVTLTDFERLQSISYDATKSRRILVGMPKQREVFDVAPDRFTITQDKTTNPRYFKVTNAAQKQYLGEPTEDNRGIKTQEDTVAFWPGTLEPIPGFTEAGGGTVLIKGKQHPIRLRSVKDPSLVFVLINTGNAPYYLQEFEVTIHQWETFLTKEAAKGLRFNPPEDIHVSIFGTKPENEKPFDAYLAKSIGLYLGKRKADWSAGQWRSRVKTLKQWAATNKDLPMILVSRESANEYAKWIGGSLPDKMKWNAVVKLVKNPDAWIEERPATLEELKSKAIDKLDSGYGASVYGLARNVRELLLDSDEFQGQPWFGGNQWGTEDKGVVPNFLDKYTGFRLVVAPK